MSSISFWTPIKYEKPISRIDKAREFVDEYFHVRGPCVFMCAEMTRPVILIANHPAKWQTALKVISYTAVFFFYGANLLFPKLPLIPGMFASQIAISCIPVVMLFAKVILRYSIRINLTIPQKGWIPPPVKNTLDDLLGTAGPIENLPVCKHASITRSDDNSLIFIRIKAAHLKDAKVGLICFAHPPSYDPAYQLEWVLLQKEDGIVVRFFDSETSFPCYAGKGANAFTSFQTGKVLEAEKPYFEELKKIIQGGKGIDRKGVVWELVRDNS